MSREQLWANFPIQARLGPERVKFESCPALLMALLLNLAQHINHRLALVDQSDNSPFLTLGNDVRATSPGHVVGGLVAR